MVLSGGRYDRLMRKFGKAGDGLGFALYLDELQRVLARPAGDDADVLVLYGAGEDAAEMLRALDGLRSQGRRRLPRAFARGARCAFAAAHWRR